MARLVTILLHLLLALTAGLGATLWAVQMRLNVTWELGLYGETSLVTAAGLMAVVVAGGMAVLQGGLALGWLMRWRLAGWGILLVTMVYVCLLPAPIRWLLIGTGILTAVELVARAPRPPEPVEPA